MTAIANYYLTKAQQLFSYPDDFLLASAPAAELTLLTSAVALRALMTHPKESAETQRDAEIKLSKLVTLRLQHYPNLDGDVYPWVPIGVYFDAADALELTDALAELSQAFLHMARPQLTFEKLPKVKLRYFLRAYYALQKQLTGYVGVSWLSSYLRVFDAQLETMAIVNGFDPLELRVTAIACERWPMLSRLPWLCSEYFLTENSVEPAEIREKMVSATRLRKRGDDDDGFLSMVSLECGFTGRPMEIAAESIDNQEFQFVILVDLGTLPIDLERRAAACELAFGHDGLCSTRPWQIRLMHERDGSVFAVSRFDHPFTEAGLDKFVKTWEVRFSWLLTYLDRRTRTTCHQRRRMGWAGAF
ncbi:MAG: hypothetical protein HOM34_04565 [Planctomycetes bacterium]|nr:hypothetical protein [Planctomycetota bacterium]MBT4561266.1 hypothetical protein [Planctomycetota bacterium]MBT5119976.1 hypothetical protein [Planctomycetota bacterium]